MDKLDISAIRFGKFYTPARKGTKRIRTQADLKPEEGRTLLARTLARGVRDDEIPPRQKRRQNPAENRMSNHVAITSAPKGSRGLGMIVATGKDDAERLKAAGNNPTALKQIYAEAKPISVTPSKERKALAEFTTNELIKAGAKLFKLTPAQIANMPWTEFYAKVEKAFPAMTGTTKAAVKAPLALMCLSANTMSGADKQRGQSVKHFIQSAVLKERNSPYPHVLDIARVVAIHELGHALMAYLDEYRIVNNVYVDLQKNETGMITSPHRGHCYSQMKPSNIKGVDAFVSLHDMNKDERKNMAEYEYKRALAGVCLGMAGAEAERIFNLHLDSCNPKDPDLLDDDGWERRFQLMDPFAGLRLGESKTDKKNNDNRFEIIQTYLDEPEKINQLERQAHRATRAFIRAIPLEKWVSMANDLIVNHQGQLTSHHAIGLFFRRHLKPAYQQKCRSILQSFLTDTLQKFPLNRDLIDDILE